MGRFIVLCCFILPFVTSTLSTSPNVTQSKGENLLFSFALPHKDSLVNLLYRVTSDADSVSISKMCRKSLIDFAEGLKGNDINSLLMLDSFSKVKPGLFSYQLTDFGHYSQCLTKIDPPARYVLLQVNHVNSSDIKNSILSEIGERHFEYHKPLLAICLPGSCSESDVSLLLQTSAVEALDPYKFTLFTSQLRGEDQLNHHQRYLRFIARLALAAIVFVNLLSTLLVNFGPEEYRRRQIYSSFDLIQNTRELLRQQSNPSQREAQFFCGIRSIFLLFSIHIHHFVPMSPASKPYFHSIIQSLYMWSPFLKLTQLLSVLTLLNLILSSALNVISWKNNTKSGETIYLSKYIFYRSFRMYPTILASFLFIASFPLFSYSTGPLMNYTQKVSIDLLVNHGWKQLLFISSFQPIDQMVLPIGWFMSTDMQLYFLAFFIVRCMLTRPKVGFYLALVMMTLGLIVHWIYLWAIDASPTLHVPMTRFHLNEQLFETVYMNSLNYISSYAIGLLLGYLIAHRIVASRKNGRIIFYLSSVLFALVVPIPGLIYDQEGFPRVNRTLELIAGVTVKPIACAALGGLFYFLWLNPRNIVNRVLSWRIFVILSRLSFSMFVIHPIQIVLLYASDSEAKVYNYNEIIIRSLFTLILCTFLSFWLFVLVENPFFKLRYLFIKSKQVDNSNIDCNSNNLKDK